MSLVPIKSVACIQEEFTKKFETVAQAQQTEMQKASEKLAEVEVKFIKARDERNAANKSIEAIRKLFGAE